MKSSPASAGGFFIMYRSVTSKNTGLPFIKKATCIQQETVILLP